MPLFDYRVVDAKGNEQDAKIAAQSIEEACVKIQNSKEHIAHIAPCSLGKKASLSLAQSAQFAELLSQLLEGSIPLIECLVLIQRSDTHKSIKERALTIEQNLLVGGSLAKSFKGRRRWQRALYVFLKTGESGGFLGKSLKRAALVLRNQLNDQQKLRQQLAYPAFLFCTAVAVFTLYFTVISPLFHDLLPKAEEIEKRSLINGFNFWMAGLMIGLMSLLFLLTNSPKFREFKRLSLRFSPWSRYCRLRDLQLIFFLLAQLMGDSKAVAETWGLARHLAIDKQLARDLALVEQRISQGDLPSQAFAGMSILCEIELQLLRIGEETGQMALAVERIGQRFDQRLKKFVSTLLKIIQPLILILIGLMITKIALLVLHPMKELQLAEI